MTNAAIALTTLEHYLLSQPPAHVRDVERHADYITFRSHNLIFRTGFPPSNASFLTIGAAFTNELERCGVAISMDGRGRALDNVFVERLWRSVKYEEVYLKDYVDGWQAERSLGDYFQFYCQRRIHQALGYRTPAQVYGQEAEEHTKRGATISG